jgi:PAS domain S-box-containing protein
VNRARSRASEGDDAIPLAPSPTGSPIDTLLERRVSWGFIVALLLTIFMGYSSWRSARLSANDSDWVVHTYAVMARLESAHQHTNEVETSARAFALLGEKSFLAHYVDARETLAKDKSEIRRLTSDNRIQQRRLDTLDVQVRAAIEYASEMVGQRQDMGAATGTREALKLEHLTDEVRATTQEMLDEETRLLNERSQKTEAQRRSTGFIVTTGVFLGAVLLTVAWFAVRREIGVSARGRVELSTLNAELEERVQQRTAALQSEIIERTQALQEVADQKFALDQHAIVATTDVQGTITYVNDKFCDISKYSRQELVGQNHRILNSSHHPKEFFQQMYHTIANGQVWRAEICNRAKDGSIYWVDTTIVPFVGPEGKPRQYVAIRADITERKRSEEALRESLATSKVALKELADQKFALDQHAIVATTDVQGTITYVNDKFCDISKYSRQELVGQNHRILNSSHHPKEFFQQMYHTIANGQVWRDEIRNRAKDGSIYWVDTTVVPFLDAYGKPRQYMAIRADITERKLAEHEILKLTEELEQRVRERTIQLEEINKELEAFTYSVAHDLRAPLRHIGGFSKLLVEDFGATLDPEARKYLERVQEGTVKMGRLVDELLGLARVGRQSLNLQATGLSSIVAEVVSLLDPETKGRQIEWKIAKLPFVDCDPTLMKQVFQNLISNALKYSRPRPQTVIEIGEIHKDGEAVIFVRDNGVGFNMKYSDKLFGVFQRLHRVEDFEGTGVGLATVHRIIQKHQGRVWAEAELDRGATFYFTIGSVDRAAPNAQAAIAGAQL